MRKLNRRNFINAGLGGAALFGFAGLLSRSELFKVRGQSALNGSLFGPLSPKATQNTGEFLLALPEGFQYNVIGKAGAPMTDGRPTPVLHDGMTVIASGTQPNAWIVIRNHENAAFAGSDGSVSGTVPYDKNAAGGTTTMIVDRTSRLISNDFVSLSGTVRNCAGGVTPWRTWISCEETTVGVSNGFARPHGYCFEVPRTGASNAVPLIAMGRFKHEAVAFERATGIAYLTEDNNPAGFYRFVPYAYGNLAAGGRLQMLAVDGQPNFDTRSSQTAGQRMTVRWVDIADPNPASAETDLTAVFQQGFALGGATFARLEGCFA